MIEITSRHFPVLPVPRWGDPLLLALYGTSLVLVCARVLETNGLAVCLALSVLVLILWVVAVIQLVRNLVKVNQSAAPLDDRSRLLDDAEVFVRGARTELKYLFFILPLATMARRHKTWFSGNAVLCLGFLTIGANSLQRLLGGPDIASMLATATLIVPWIPVFLVNYVYSCDGHFINIKKYALCCCLLLRETNIPLDDVQILCHLDKGTLTLIGNGGEKHYVKLNRLMRPSN